MNPDLERRLTELADAAAHATTGMDPVAALAVFRRRRRVRTAASAVAAVAAVVGLALGTARLAAPGPAPEITPATPTADSWFDEAESPACGLPLAEGFAAVTRMAVTTQTPSGAGEISVTAALRAGSAKERGELALSTTVEFVPGPWSDNVVHPSLFRLWLLVADGEGTVVGWAESWNQEDGVPGLERDVRVLACPGATSAGALGQSNVVARIAAATALPDLSHELSLAPPLPLSAGGPDATAPPEDEAALACGLPPDEAFAAITGVPVEAQGPNVTHDMEISLGVDAGDLEASRVLSTTSLVAFPGVEPPVGARPPYTFRVWLLVTGSAGTVVGFTEPWEQPDKELVEGRSTVLERCPDASWAGIRQPELFHVHAATAPVGETPPRHLVLGDPLPLFMPEPVWLDGPGSCGRSFFLDGVTETVGAEAGLWVDIEYANLAHDGTLTAHLTIRNTVEIPHTGALTLTEFLVEGDTLPYAGSVLTPTDPVLLDEHTTIPPGGQIGLDVELELAACADDVLPLAPGSYTVSTSVELAAGGEPLGFSSPALTVTVD